MKFRLLILLSFLQVSCLAQQDPATLARDLAAGKKTELEKVTAIFRWITENISYKTRSAPGKTSTGAAAYRNFYQDEEEGPLKSLNERVSLGVLRKKEAVCDGFSRLFTTLCDHAGIRSEIIVGYARGGNGKQQFTVNHNWNAVMIDEKWYLLDVTWASGYLSPAGDEFIRRFDPHYFLTPPRIFLRDHYPDDLRWTLIDDPQVPEEYRRSPFKQKSFFKYSIRSYYPSTGIIEAAVGDTLRFKIETAMKERDMNICPDLLVDTTIFTHSSSWVFLKPEPGNRANEFQYTFTVGSTNVQWLYLLYNEDMVLRYKVNIKSRPGLASSL